MKDHSTLPDKQFTIFSTIWVGAVGFLAWQVWLGQHSPNLLLQWPTFIVLTLVTLALILWIPNPIPKLPATKAMEKMNGGQIILIIITCGLFALPIVLGADLLWLLPCLSIIILVILHMPLIQRVVGYCFFLGVISSIAAMWAGWITQFTPFMWAVIQFLLVSTGCTAGWQLIRNSSLAQYGIGQSCLLEQGPLSALRHFAKGFIIALPWALSIIILSGHLTERWVMTWWHPFIAIQPAVAEEAWGRLLLVPLLFYLTSRIYQPRRAFSIALFIVGYWFAFLHTVDSPGAIINTFFTGTLFVMPVSYLCLYADFETAVGFHFCIDFIKFSGAFIILRLS